MFHILNVRKQVLSLLSVVAFGVSVAGFVGLPAPATAQNRTLPDFTDLVEQVGPSVVNIRTIDKPSSQPTAQNQPIDPQDEEMQELFRRFFGMPPPNPNAPRQQRPNRPQQPQPEDQPRGVGSGFILTADGFIMTNAHVVDGAQQVIVTLTDKREFVARIIGIDKRTDVAVVKIEASGLPPVKLGDPNRLKVGEWVMARATTCHSFKQMSPSTLAIRADP